MIKYLGLDNNIIYVGENKYDNDYMYKKIPENSIFFHLNDLSSAHVYITFSDKIENIGIKLVEQCCFLTKKHSKAKNKKNALIIYTYKKNIEKTNNIGEVLIKNKKLCFYYIIENNIEEHLKLSKI